MEIDEELRNRVVGASVVTILAMIFLPMLLNDSKSESQQTELLTIPEQSLDSPSLTATLLPEGVSDVLVTEESLPPKESKPQVLAVAKKPRPIIDESPIQLPPVSEIPVLAAPVLAAPVEETLQADRWFIQVASFNREENAFSFRDKLRNQGFSALVSSALSKGRTVYRLRVGPELSKPRAKEIKTKLNQLNNVKSIIILAP
ncbi:MAG: SPOR domain-containing protein [Methylococcales bacterium]|nr:SPOR domain-containing protein [Methylococcales bacterium]